MSVSHERLVRARSACSSWCRARIWFVVCILGLAPSARAEIPIAEVDDWKLSTDGRINGFVSHVWGNNRPGGLESLNWVGFNESTDQAQAGADGKLRRTRLRSGYVPSVLAFNLKKQVAPELRASARVETGFQITTQEPSSVGDHAWMEPRSVYLDLAGSWGSVRAGRDWGLFGRGNLFMNYALGHAYGVGFPCSYETVFGGSCGHVGFGTIFPDFRAQLTYSTPKLGDVFQLSAGVFDPRTVPTQGFVQTPLPRFEAEAVAEHHWEPDWGVKAWVNAFQQKLGTSADVPLEDAAGVPTGDTERRDFSLTAAAVGGGLQADMGPVQLGAAGHAGKGLDGFLLLSFNPIINGLAPDRSYNAEFRPTKAFLLHGAYHFWDAWLSLGYGSTLLDRVDTDFARDAVDAPPLLRKQTGISVGLYQRVGNVVFGIDYFRASYRFDTRLITPDAEMMLPEGALVEVQVSQDVQALNGGATLEW